MKMTWFSTINRNRNLPSAGGSVVAFDLPPDMRRPVVLTVTNPATAAILASVAARIAAARQTGVALLHVSPTRTPAAAAPDTEPTSWPALAAALTATRQTGAAVGWIVRMADDVGQAIRETAAELNAALVILGWRGASPQHSASLAAVLEDPIFDVAIVGGRPVDSYRRILISVGAGPHAALAARLAHELAHDTETTSITALHIVASGRSPSHIFAAAERQFRATLGHLSRLPHVTRKTVVGDDTAQAILDELSVGYDAVLMGTSREALIDRLAFGELPQRVAEESQSLVIIARRHTPMVTRLLRNAWRQATAALPTLTASERDEVRATIQQGARSRADFFIMIGLAAVLAALGLLLNSPAVIIGAMLVAPLMSAIVGLGLGVVAGDVELLVAAAWASLRGMSLAIAIGSLLGLLVPDATATAEIMSRTQPNVLDLGVALASGAAGAYALCRKGVSAGLAGVAIAAALVPPLTVVGIGLALARSDIAGGALLLFLTNLVAIAAAGGLVFLMLGFAPTPDEKARRNVLRRGLAGALALLAVVTLILALLTVQTLRSVRLDRAVQAAVGNEVSALLPESEFVELKQTLRDDGTLQLVVTVRSPQQYSYDAVLAFQRQIATRIQRPVALLLNVIPATRLDPLAPPTFTPTSTLTPTPTPGPTATPTATPTPTASPSPAATATVTPTVTPTATVTATPSATPSATVAATPQPTPGFAVIANANNRGAYLRRFPGGEVIGAVAEGTLVILLGERVAADGRIWVHVMAAGKPEGWIALDYLTIIPSRPAN